jgi:hypothetical protein
LYAFLFQFLTTILGVFMFTKEYNLKFSFLKLPAVAITYIPYQVLLGISAVRAVYRELCQKTNWEKTNHLGAHRLQKMASSENSLIRPVEGTLSQGR